ncbi:tyrosine--tRNA ligase, chloroplastic/mitochondrial-like [Phalaenopsis equestris]|uniref:tyrosine--tRNA ligase, chloroplastic/mitochondrial-like n=1 Tax=Phalaenopsis equestris TaxID=78828 RepID=UPI0009E5BD19|nr:tyrosine--tRNA ligase, chloroplastic/mitochondrial-like [Phalaenopsis equestris]
MPRTRIIIPHPPAYPSASSIQPAAAMAAAAAAMTAILRPSNPHFIYPKHRLSPRFYRLCSSSLTSSQLAIPNVIDILRERGLVESLTSENLRSACSNPNSTPVKVYCGFDPTAESLHLGNLIGIIVLHWFRRCGHKTVALIGGATGRIGDPSGKSLERPELGVQTIENNSAEIRAQLYRILHRANKEMGLKRGCPNDEILSLHPKDLGDSFLVLDNFDWWKEIKCKDFLREVGGYVRVGTMTAKESVKKRLMSEEGLSFTEFSYQLFQGYDFCHMFKNMAVNVQIGGTDQWGNITVGTEFIRKILRVEGAYGLTFPLLLKSDGSKFGKSEGGAIWLSPAMLSPYLEEIQELEESMKKPDYVPNSVQRRLAEEVTRFVHGEAALVEAVKETEADDVFI